MYTPTKINLNNQGLSMLMGELEAQILELIWQNGGSRVTIRELCGYLESQNKKLSFNTIMTVANRMVKKEILIKERTLGQYMYSTVCDREIFLKELKNYVDEKLKNFNNNSI